jgi:hypothetical protein
LIALLGKEVRRKLELKYLSNDQLFPTYYADLALKITNEKNLKCIRQLLDRFKDYLGNFPPSEMLAKSFLSHMVNQIEKLTYEKGRRDFPIKMDIQPSNYVLRHLRFIW